MLLKLDSFIFILFNFADSLSLLNNTGKKNIRGEKNEKNEKNKKNKRIKRVILFGAKLNVYFY